MKKYLLSFFILNIATFCLAQKPVGKFIDKKLWVGKPVQFAYVYEHNNNSDLVFPDSNYNFKPFKYAASEYFPTKNNGLKSIDSVIYTLITFEIDSVYTLSLPIVNLKSKQKVYSVPTKIAMQNFVGKVDLLKPKVKPTLSFYLVPNDFNFPKLLYYLGVLLISALVFFVFFGKRLKKLAKIILFNFKHREFTSGFKKLSKLPKNNKNISGAIVIWKYHMEWLLKKPFSTMTTKEITARLKNERLDDALKEFDAALYGGQISDQMPFAFNILYDIASDTFKTQKIEFRDNI
jgi:hypothetical protein